MDRVALWIPLAVGLVATAFTVVVHAAAVAANLRFVRHERALGRMGVAFWIDVQIVSTAVMMALLAHLIEIALWAEIFIGCGEFRDLGLAFYHSAMNYTTLGYGDIVMSPAWKMLGPIEAADGMLMFGVSTAMIFAVIHRLVQIRFPDLLRP
jgi:hypothetical protein